MYSGCSNMKPELVLKIAQKREINGLAITDHNKVEGAIKVKSINKDPDFEVIIGSEVLTRQGELLAYYIQEPIRSKDIFEAIDLIRDQGGIVAIAHPFAIVRPHLTGNFKPIIKKLDALECFNSRNVFEFENKKAARIAREFDKATLGSSDAHFYFEIGNARTCFDGSLTEAIKRRKTSYKGVKADFLQVAINAIRNRSLGLRK